jgi:hypothetical protein
MRWRGLILAVLLGSASIAHAADVRTYGAGLRPCKDYLEARKQQTPELVGFTDWLSGYLSGVNTTSAHRNNFLNHEDLRDAMQRVHEYCQAHPSLRLAEASWVLVRNAKTGSAAHSVEVTAYGSGYKSCLTYRQARADHTLELNVDNTEFIAWLGGYLSGVNAISSTSENVLGNTGLTQAMQWLDSYCDSHEQNSFGVAVQALLDEVPTGEHAAHLADAVVPAVSTQTTAVTKSRAQ